MLYFKSFLFTLFVLFFLIPEVSVAVTPEEGVPFTVVVIDSAQNTPLQLVHVSLRRHGRFIAGKVTDVSGRAIFKDISPGWYTLAVRFVGYADFNDSILLDKAQTLTIKLKESEHEELEVGGEKETDITTVDVKTGSQIFEAEDYHGSPNTKISSIIQQNVLGAAK